MTIVYDRTKTVVRRHVGRGQDVPLHPEAIAFAAHNGFGIRVCWPERPQSKGRVESVVKLTRQKALAGRTFGCVEEMQAAWDAWLPTRRAQVHRTHGEVIAHRAEIDRAALQPVPDRPYVVCERHLRVVGKDALVSFEASLYSVPWTAVRPRQRVELRVKSSSLEIWSIGEEPRLFATHARARTKGSWVIDDRHWDGLPDGTRPEHGPQAVASNPEGTDPEADSLARLIVRTAAAAIPVARRDPVTYDRAFDVGGGR